MFEVKKTGSILLIIVLILSSFAGITMAEEATGTDYALFVTDGIQLSNNVSIIGNAVIRDIAGSGEFYLDNLTSGKKIKINEGKIYVDNFEAYEDNENVSQAAFNGTVPALKEIVLPEFPTDLPEATQATGWAHTTIEASCWYKQGLNIANNGTIVKVITTSEDETINIRTNVLTIANAIVIEGPGTVNFYTDRLVRVSGADAIINQSGTAKVNIYAKNSGENVSLPTLGGHFNLYLPDSSVNIGIKSGTGITGNIYCGGDVTLGTSGNVNGLVYAPQGKVSVSGSATVNGKIIAKEAAFDGSARVVYDGSVTDVYGILAGSGSSEEPGEEEPAPSEDLSTLHFSNAYLYGYGWGDVGADEYLTREEVSAILYRLLKQNNKTTGFVKPAVPTFKDLSATQWSYSAIEYMTSKGIFDSSSDKVFPGSKISRGEAARIICLALNIPLDEDGEQIFTDLPTDNYYFKYIDALVDKGVIEGMDDGTVGVSSDLKRCQFVKMINILIGRDVSYDLPEVNPYPDLKPTHWAYEYILMASFGYNEQRHIDPSKKPPREEIDYD